MLLEGLAVDGRPASVVAAGAALRFCGSGRTAQAERGHGENVQLLAAPDPLGQLVDLASRLRLAGDEVPPVLTAWFGTMAYDAVRCFEHLPHPPPAASHLPADFGPPGTDYAFFLPELTVWFDLEADRAWAAAVTQSGRSGAEALAALTSDLTRCSLRPGLLQPVARRLAPCAASLTRREYGRAVRRAKQYILDGDIFQVVLSVRLDVPCQDDPFAVYGRLKSVNPSPFHFCYVDGSTALVGASPEPLVTAHGRRCAIRLLAGTRPRGPSGPTDQALEAELRASEKEAAEHRMLVDLARNDLGRVCSPATVGVDELMAVERYSHVMHLVSNVIGEIAPGQNVDDLIRATFPAGTMTGAPKIRAMEIIDELEPVRRGTYSGAVGFIAADQVQLYLTIRSTLIHSGVAAVQAGAGIVHDSQPDAEYDECWAKMQSTLSVLGSQSGADP